LPSTFTWSDNVDGSFLDPTKWVDQNNHHGVPGPADNAIVPYSGITVTVPTSVSVNSLSDYATLHIVSGATLTLSNAAATSGISPLDLDSGATLRMTGGSTSLNATSTVAGGFDVAPSAKLVIAGSASFGSGTSFKNSGLYEVAGTASINASMSAPVNLKLDSSGTIAVSTSSVTFTSPGTLNWTGGTIGGDGTLDVAKGGTLNISGNSDKYLGDNATLRIDGTAMWTGTGNIGSAGAGGKEIDNNGQFITTYDDSMTGSFAFDNNGTFIKELSGQGQGVGTTRIGTAIFDNNSGGTVDVKTGTLSASPVGPAASQHSGKFIAEKAATVAFDGGSQTLNAGTELTGAGAFIVEQDIQLLGTNILVDYGVTVTPSFFFVYSGTLDLRGTVNVPAFFGWSGGTITDVGTITVPSSARMTVSGSDTKTLAGGATLNNSGIGLWTGTGPINLGSGVATFNNLGTLNVQSDSSLTGITFNNVGTLTKSGTTGTTGFEYSLNSTGALNVNSGTVSVYDRGTLAGPTFVAAGAQLRLSNFFGGFNTYIGINKGATFSGPGTYLETSDDSEFVPTVAFNTPVSIPNFQLDNGALTGDAILTVTKQLKWTGGEFDDSLGTVSMPQGSRFLIQGNTSRNINGRTFNLGGQTTWSGNGGIYLSGTINNLPGAVFTIENDQPLNGPGTLRNGGTLTKVLDSVIGSGTDTTTIYTSISNTGTIVARSGTLNLKGSIAQISAGPNSALTGGTWNVISMTAPVALLLNASIATIGKSASVTVDGMDSTFNDDLVDLATNNGSLSLYDGAELDTNGSLTSTGMLMLGVPTQLNVGGNLTLSSTSMLGVWVTGTPNQGQFGAISAKGTVALAGTLNIWSLPTFSPNIGDAYTIITGSSVTGTFAKLNGLNLPGNKRFLPVYDPSDFTLKTAAAAPAPADVTSKVSIQYGGYQFNHAASQMVQTLVITNTSKSAIVGPIYVVLDGLQNGILVNATGTTTVSSPAGSPYIRLSLGASNALAAGKSVTVVLTCADPQGLRISYTSRVLSGSGTP
jgi:hypothetical protein